MVWVMKRSIFIGKEEDLCEKILYGGEREESIYLLVGSRDMYLVKLERGVT